MEFNAEGDPDKAKFVAIVDEYFSLLDTDGSGTINKDEVEEGLMPTDQSDVLDQMDADGDGKISKEVFLEYLVEDVEDDDGDYLDDEIEAEADDTVPSKVTSKRGIQQDFMRAIHDRLKIEMNGKTKGLEATWLLEYLKENDHWVRKEHALKLVKVLLGMFI